MDATALSFGKPVSSSFICADESSCFCFVCSLTLCNLAYTGRDSKVSIGTMTFLRLIASVAAALGAFFLYTSNTTADTLDFGGAVYCATNETAVIYEGCQYRGNASHGMPMASLYTIVQGNESTYYAGQLFTDSQCTVPSTTTTGNAQTNNVLAGSCNVWNDASFVAPGTNGSFYRIQCDGDRSTVGLQFGCNYPADNATCSTSYPIVPVPAPVKPSSPSCPDTTKCCFSAAPFEASSSPLFIQFTFVSTVTAPTYSLSRYNSNANCSGAADATFTLPNYVPPTTCSFSMIGSLQTPSKPSGANAKKKVEL